MMVGLHSHRMDRILYRSNMTLKAGQYYALLFLCACGDRIFAGIPTMILLRNFSDPVQGQANRGDAQEWSRKAVDATNIFENYSENGKLLSKSGFESGFVWHIQQNGRFRLL